MPGDGVRGRPQRCQPWRSSHSGTAYRAHQVDIARAFLIVANGFALTMATVKSFATAYGVYIEAFSLVTFTVECVLRVYSISSSTTPSPTCYEHPGSHVVGDVNTDNGRLWGHGAHHGLRAGSRDDHLPPRYRHVRVAGGVLGAGFVEVVRHGEQLEAAPSPVCGDDLQDGLFED